MKESYTRTELEIVRFSSDDVITTSGCFTGGNNLPEDDL